MFKLLCFSLLTFTFIHAAPLKVGTNAEFPPFCFHENNEIVGFDIDIAKEVALRLKQDIQFKDMPFEALIPDILMGQVDFVAAGMSYSDERAKRVLFTKPYLSEDPLVIFSMNQEYTIDDLKNKKVIVIEGFMADVIMSQDPELQLIRLSNQADGFMALKSKRADVFVTAKSTVNTFLATQNDNLFFQSVLPGTGETCALVVPKCKSALLMDIQKALDEMEQDGTITTLKKKWNLL